MRALWLGVVAVSLVAGCGDNGGSGADAAASPDATSSADAPSADAPAIPDGAIADAALPDAAPAVTRYLILSDGDTTALPENQIESALVSAGHVVTVGPHYAVWDGAAPAATDFDVIIWLEGTDYGDVVTSGGDAALVSFVNNGGVLLRTEWGAWHIASAGTTETIDTMLPVIPDTGYEYGSSWSVTTPSHPLAANLPAAFAVPASGITYVSAETNATVVFEDESNRPMLTVKDFGLGKVVHLNNDITYSVSTLQAEILQVFVNLSAL